MKKIQILARYIKYWRVAKGRHGTHSPFVYHFVDEILHNQKEFYAFANIANLRKKLYADNSKIEVEDFGAGSHNGKSITRKIKDIARTAGRNEKWGKLLFKMVDYYQPNIILELGTSLGIATSYMALAKPNAHITTVEGSKTIAEKARENFAFLDLKNIKQVVGNFDNNLDYVLNTTKNLDFVFIDGNHQYEPTITYFKKILKHTNENCILIFDDIHWSIGMENAWKKINSDPQVLLSIDLFFFGIIVFNPDFKVKQHFVLK